MIRTDKILFLLFFSAALVFSGSVPASAQDEGPLSSDSLSSRLLETVKKADRVTLLIELAEAYVREGTPDKAVMCLTEALDMEPEQKKQQNIYRLLGDIYFSKKQYTDAINSYRESVVLAPDHEGVRLSLAHAYEKSELFELALSEYSKILEMDPKSFEANFNLGNLYMDEGFPEKAVPVLRKSLTLRMDARAYRNLAACYEMIGDENLAVSMIKSAIAVEPTYGDYIELGKLYQSRKKYKEAEDNYLKAEQIDKGRIDAYVFLGILYLEKNNIDDAKTVLLAGKEKFPESAIMRFFLGEIYYRQKNFALAKTELQKSLSLSEEGMLKNFAQKLLNFINKSS